MKSDFLNQLPVLLRLLADPRTPHTVSELWCRVFSYGWEECEAILLADLKSGDSDVQRLVIEIIMEHAGNSGIDSIRSFVPTIVSLLSHEDRLVRSCAISAVGELMVDDKATVDALRHIVCTDEPLLASAAAQVLIQFDPQIIKEVVQLLRDNAEDLK
jgi:HEAT repeat protein